jgi:glycerol dehydrogenase-like iron-containing ADH family enzyme
LRDLLRAVGAPATAAEIGLTASHLGESVRVARMIRRRYTAFDLAAEAGLLDACVDAVTTAEPTLDASRGRA